MKTNTERRKQPRAPGDHGFFGHPTGLSTLFFTEMWERFSFYGLRPLLILFMSASLFDSGFGFDRDQASAIVGIYAASVYLASLPGGWIADRLLGLRRAIIYGAILISLGHLSISASSFMHSPVPFFLGLILIVLGTGLLKPNISAIVGDLYSAEDPRRDGGFSIFYMGINIGAFFGQIITGFLGETIGWHYGFGAAGIGMLIGLAIFAFFAKRTLGTLGLEPAKDSNDQAQAKLESRIKTTILIGLGALAVAVLLIGTGVMTVSPQVVGQNLGYVLVCIAIIYFAYLFISGGLSGDEKKRVVLIFILFIFAAIFWSAFEQAPTSLNLFARDFTNRAVDGRVIPVTWFQSVNSLFIFLLAPIIAAIWTTLGRRKQDLSSTTKFALGLFFAGVGFLVMLVAANEVVAGKGLLQVSPMWLIASYFFQTVGELCLSPVGLSSMTKLAPRKFAGQMMGVWFLAASLGNLIGGLVGGQVDPEKLEQMPRLFMATSVLLLASAFVLLVLTPLVKKYLKPSTIST